MSAVDEARANLRQRKTPPRVVMPEPDDPRIAEAATRLEAEGIARVIDVPARASEAQVTSLAARRGVTKAVAGRMLSRPLYRAAAVVASGEAEALVAGVTVPTRRVIEAASMVIGPAPGIAAPSSFFLMRFPDGVEMVWADCALTVAPDAETLAAIATASASSARALLGSARVAMLSYATGTSGAGASVDAVREAAAMAGVAGPLQGDAALNPVIARAKGAELHEPANVLVFPNLDAANIAYKLAQELAGARAVGPILQGYARPVCDLSRGARVDEIVEATILTLALGD